MARSFLTPALLHFLGALALGYVRAFANPVEITGPWALEISRFASVPSLPSEVLHAKYAFGWSGLRAGSLSIDLQIDNKRFVVAAKGGTEGVARSLWKLDAQFFCEGFSKTLQTYKLTRLETYRTYQIFTEAVFENGVVTRRRFRLPASVPEPSPRSFRIPDARDPAAVALMVRRHIPPQGGSVAFLCWPGESLYFVRIKNEGAAECFFNRKHIPALLLTVDLWEIGIKKENMGQLRRHPFFRTAKVWIDLAPPHLPIRAEINLFIGSIFAELLQE